MITGKNYTYVISESESGIKYCDIYSLKGSPKGYIKLDKDNVWTPFYADGIKYLPINSALKLLDYESTKESEIE